ncbi:MAG: DUF1573 domain-containing protein [Mariprofundaceae bacterium]
MILRYLFLLFLCMPVVAYAELPVLHVQPEMLDMGSILEGEEAKATFIIRNNSEKMIELNDVETSCGCTAAKPNTRVLPPGGFTQLQISIDTTAKLGNIKKWIRVTDSAGHEAKVWLSFKVKASEHASKANHGIFDGKCATCHFDPAQGKIDGANIYAAVCAMCHGKDAVGAYAPSLRHHNDINVLQQLIAEGTGTQHMPGFGKKVSGPLNEKQLRTLSEWLLSLD